MENKAKQSSSKAKCLHFAVFLLVLCLFVSDCVGQDSAAEAGGLQGVCSACSCQLVTSSQGHGRDMQIACDGLGGGEVPSMDRLVWESMQEDRVFATFQHLDWKTIQKLPKNDRIVYLNLNYNQIRYIDFFAFADIRNLESLYISNNELERVSPDIFKNLAKLLVLDLSYNKLTEFNRLDFQELTSLKVLSLNYNQITKIPVETLKKLTSLEELDLSGNQIISQSMKFGDPEDPTNILKKLTRLNLSSNLLTTLQKDILQGAAKLESLDLSQNSIGSVLPGTFDSCSSLKSVDLSHNKLQQLESLPHSIVTLQLRHNLLSSIAQLPDSLQELDISENKLVDISNEVYTSPSSLKVLNISGNALSSLDISRPVPELKVLDISYNQFVSVPGGLSSVKFPQLRAFSMNGNPIENLVFPSAIELNSISANFLVGVTTIDASSFEKVRTRADSGSSCLDLSISNSNLQSIGEKSFQGINLCHLDLSNNNLTTLSENVAQWGEVPRGVNLQHNPWDCQCPLQWVLDTLLQDLYKHHSGYLVELRCASPRGIQGLRFVQWHSRGKGAFCRGEGEGEGEDLQRSYNNILMQASNQDPGVKVLMGNGTLFISVLVGIFVGLVLIGTLIVYLVRGKYRHNYRVRRQMMKKRQEMSDAVYLNTVAQKENETLKV